MRAMLQSLISHLRPENATEKAVVKNLLDRHQKLISRRNDVLHGTWFIGYGNEETTDWSTAVGFKLGKDRKGAKHKTFEYNVENFEEMIKEAEDLTAALDRLTGCFTAGSDVEKNFNADNDGRVSIS
jgi:aldehyde:ferredoxin oxidoreductase